MESLIRVKGKIQISIYNIRHVIKPLWMRNEDKEKENNVIDTKMYSIWNEQKNLLTLLESNKNEFWNSINQHQDYTDFNSISENFF